MDYNYFVEHRIVTSGQPINLELNPAYIPFTDEQNTFYAEHPDANYWEVKNCEMNPEPVPPTLDDIKESAKEYLSQLSLDTMGRYVREYQFENAQSSLYMLSVDPQAETIYDEAKAMEVMGTYTIIGRELRGKYKEAEANINTCETAESVATLRQYYEDYYINYEYTPSDN